MHWKSCASRSALPSWSPGRKKKIHAVLEVSWWFLYFRLSRPGWDSYLGIPVNEPCPFQQLPRGLGSCPEARISIRRPRRATWVPWGTSYVSTLRAWRGRMKTGAAAEPRSWSWKLRRRWVTRWSTPSINLVCVGKGSNRPTWVLTVWPHQIAVEALEGLSFHSATPDSSIWTRFRTVDSLMWLHCLFPRAPAKGSS